MADPASSRPRPDTGNGLEPGYVAEVPYPFVRETYQQIEQDGDGEDFGVTFTDVPTWKPGIRCDGTGENTDNVADGMGRMVLTVVSVHKPGRFPARVFYTRQWVDPDGKQFGKGKLRITTVGAFRRRARGFWVDFEMTNKPSGDLP